MTNAVQIVDDRFFWQHALCSRGETLGFKLSDVRKECNDLGLPLCGAPSSDGKFSAYVPLHSTKKMDGSGAKIESEVLKGIETFPGISFRLQMVMNNAGQSIPVFEVSQSMKPARGVYSAHALSIHLSTSEGRDFVRALSAAFNAAHSTDLSMPASGPVLLTGQICSQLEYAPSNSEMLESTCAYLYPVSPYASLVIPAVVVKEGEEAEIATRCKEFVRTNHGFFIRLDNGVQVAHQVQIPIERIETLVSFIRDLGADVRA